MAERPAFAVNIERIRNSKGLTQQESAGFSGLSRIGLRDIEHGKTKEPRVSNLQSIANALDVGLQDLLAEPPYVKTARFRSQKLRSKKNLAQREEIVSRSARWLKDFVDLERRLEDQPAYALATVARKVARLASYDRACKAAAMVRDALGIEGSEPIRDICGLLESAGIKIHVEKSQLAGFFGMSIDKEDGGPAIVVNTAEPITVERQIFTAAHELGHLLLHPGAFDTTKVDENKQEEDESDAFAS